MLTKPEIKLAAEAIAATVWERGGSLDQAEVETRRAFRRDRPRERDLAVAVCRDFFAAVDA